MNESQARALVLRAIMRRPKGIADDDILRLYDAGLEIVDDPSQANAFFDRPDGSRVHMKVGVNFAQIIPLLSAMRALEAEGVTVRRTGKDSRGHPAKLHFVANNPECPPGEEEGAAG